MIVCSDGIIGADQSLYPARNLYPATAKEIGFNEENGNGNLPAEFAKAGTRDLPDWSAIRVGLSKGQVSK